MTSADVLSKLFSPDGSLVGPGFREMLDELPLAIYATDANGMVTYFNPAAASLAGRIPHIGEDHWCVSWQLRRPDGSILPHDECPMARALQQKRPIRGEELIAVRPDGGAVSILPFPTPIFDEQGAITGAVNVLFDITDRKSVETALHAKTERIEDLASIVRSLSSDIPLDKIVQLVTDSATRLSGAKFGAFFYNVIDEAGESFQLFTLSGAPRSAFETFGMPRNTAVFSPTFSGERTVRSDDIQLDSRYGKSAPHFGMPKGHLPVRSYLAVPVLARSGEVLGGLFFGHDKAGVFSQESEQIVQTIAAHAAIAIDNARLLVASQRDSDDRRRAEVTIEHLASIVENTSDAVVSTDTQDIIKSWNKGAENLFGYSAEEIVGKTIVVLIPSNLKSEENELLDRVRNGERIEPYETQRLRKDGTPVDVSLTVSPILDGDHRIVGVSKIARDITERKRSEAALSNQARQQAALHRLTERLHRARRIEEAYAAALDAIQAALVCSRASILLFDQTDKMRFVAWRGLSDRYRAAVDGHSPWRAEARNPAPIFIDDLNAVVVSEELRTAVRDEGIGAIGFIPMLAGKKLIGKFMAYYDQPHTFSVADSELALTISRQLGFSIQKIRSDQARRQAQAELREKEAKERARATELQTLMEAVPAAIWIARTSDCSVISGNRRSFELLRLPPNSNSSLSAPPDERPEHFQVYSEGKMLEADELPVQRAARGEEVANFEAEVRFADGTSRHLFGNATPLRETNGQLVGAVAAFVDITERKQVEAALRESEGRLQMALDAGRMGAWDWDIVTGKVIWSPGLERLHGLEPGAFGGTIEDFKRDIHPDDLAAVEQQISTSIETHQDYHASYRIRIPDETIRWVEAFGRHVPSQSGGDRRLAGVCMDVTERKASDAQLSLLVAELSHRVKNTLATVNSIARQSFASNPDVEEAQRSFGARIRALGQTHTRLAESSWAGVSLETIVRDELAPYREDGDGHFEISGPHITLTPKRALTLGMAMHELATNAAKYGALSTQHGEVSVTWHVTKKPPELQIQWREANGPRVKRPQRHGFGRLLLERVLVGEFGGSVRLDFAEKGLTCSIELPLTE